MVTYIKYANNWSSFGCQPDWLTWFALENQLYGYLVKRGRHIEDLVTEGLRVPLRTQRSESTPTHTPECMVQLVDLL